MPKPAPPPTDLEALVRRSKKPAETITSVDMAALVRRPAKAPKMVEPTTTDMEALVRRPAKTAPANTHTHPVDMHDLVNAPRRAAAARKAEETRVEAYARHRVAGLSPAKAAVAAGFPEGASTAYLDDDPAFQARLAALVESRRPPSAPQSTGSGFYGKSEPPREATLREYTLYAMARNKGFDGSMQDYYEAHLKPQAPDMAALVQRNNRPAAPPSSANMEALVRRPQAPVAPANANTLRNQQVKDLIESARRIEPSLVDGMRFNTRLHRFLDLRPTAWTTWGEDEARVIVQSASAQAEASRQLSLANAVKWAAECEQAYAKPPGFLDRFAQNAKPEFYSVRLEQARDMLIKVQDDLQVVQDRLRENLERLRIDVLVLQVTTDKETDPSNQITASGRLKTLVQVQTTGAMILQGSESLAQTAASQAATVSSLLTVTIPNWIMALQSR